MHTAYIAGTILRGNSVLFTIMQRTTWWQVSTLSSGASHREMPEIEISTDCADLYARLVHKTPLLLYNPIALTQADPTWSIILVSVIAGVPVRSHPSPNFHQLGGRSIESALSPQPCQGSSTQCLPAVAGIQKGFSSTRVLATPENL